MIDWLVSPIDTSRAHDIGTALSWHARLMVLSWGTLTPVAIIMARFFKITPRQKWPQELDNTMWWNAHYLGQSASFAIACVAVLLVFVAPQNLGGISLHRALGYAIMSLGALQILSGVFRGSKGGPTAPQANGSLRGDHYDMTRHRLIFEFVHKTVGYVTLGLIVVAILTGLWAANAPNWMWLVICGWWLLLLVLAIGLQRRGHAYDTYQAIWGPSLEHPGNREPKKGIWTERPSESLRFSRPKSE